MSTLYDSIVESPNGELGYIMTVEQLLLSPHGRDAFFRKVSRSGKILRAVYHGLQYDRFMRDKDLVMELGKCKMVKDVLTIYEAYRKAFYPR